MKLFSQSIFIIVLFLSLCLDSSAQSVAREWNELNLNGVRNDRARPTITARNLWHTSAAMYDAWAAYDDISETYFLGKTVDGFTIPFDGVTIPATEAERIEAQEEAISYAAYRVLSHRYNNLPGNNEIAVNQAFNNLMATLGYSTSFTSTDYVNDGPAALGNYIGQQIIAFGLQDGANEDDGYDNLYYESLYLTPPDVPLLESEALVTQFDGNPTMKDPNRWQPLSLIVNVDQAGNLIPVNTPDFLSPEWGNVTPFSFTEQDLDIYERDGHSWNVFCDPGAPPYIDTLTAETGLSDNYKWGNALVVIWSALLDYNDGQMIDISPNNIGNVPSYPTSFDDFPDFYGLTTGLDTSEGYDMNPATGLPYEEQWVPMGDYGRVLAEFWADGPDSETPPGHWYSILNYVSDNPLLEKRWGGQGPILSDLEWDIKTYFTMGATVHDCAIAAWSIKGYYDYVRPISAIRWMGDMGQSSDANLPSYHPAGMPLVDGFIELVEVGDTILVGDSIIVDATSEHLHKIKVRSWKGPDYLDQINLANQIIDGVQDSTLAGVGWVLTEDWWPYQRPSFVTPPFAGYVSGHSTYSRGAAEVMKRMTGDEFFPGGMGIFDAEENNFLVFENGPSQFLELQWAKYTDASDQCSLSRIFGGIHPPADDIPGRIIGEKVGIKTFDLASSYVAPTPKVIALNTTAPLINDAATANDFTVEAVFNLEMDATSTPVISFSEDLSQTLTLTSEMWTSSTTYVWTYSTTDADVDIELISVDITGGTDLNGELSEDFTMAEALEIDTENPTVTACEFIEGDLNETAVGTGVSLQIEFSEEATQTLPTLAFVSDDPLVNSLVPSITQPGWTDVNLFVYAYDVADADEELYNMALQISDITDLNGNSLVVEDVTIESFIDTKAPETLTAVTNLDVVNESLTGLGTFTITVDYDNDLDPAVAPIISFPAEDVASTLLFNESASEFTSPSSYSFAFDVTDADVELENIDIMVTGAMDLAGNTSLETTSADLFGIDTQAPLLMLTEPNLTLLGNAELGEGTFSIQATFDSDLDQTNAPVLSFPVEDASASLEVNTTESMFIGTDGYLFVFNVLDDEVELSDIDISISNAFDLAMNPYVEETIVDVFSIDTKAPEVTEFSYSANIIAEADAGSTLTLDLTFDESTDQTDLELLFNPSQPASLELNSGQWVSDTEYSAVYNITDENEELEFTISVTSATDLFGNSTATPQVLEESVILDNRNPEATATVNTEDITVTNAVDGFTVTVLFDEEMDTTVTPELTFPDEDPTASLTLTASSAWSGNAYVFDYTVDNLSVLPFIDIEVSGAQDAYGNPMASTDFIDYFSLQLDTFLTVNELEIKDIKIYPNPVSQGDKFIIQTDQIKQYELMLYDINGRQVQADWNQTGEATLELSTVGMAAGKYFVRLIGENSNTVLRIEILN